MADNRVAYECECGRHWTVAREDADISKKLKCNCGRTLVVGSGFIYSTKAVGESNEVIAI